MLPAIHLSVPNCASPFALSEYSASINPVVLRESRSKFGKRSFKVFVFRKYNTICYVPAWHSCCSFFCNGGR